MTPRTTPSPATTSPKPGAELGYLSGGDWDVNGHEFSNQGATLSILGRLPLNDIFSVFAEGGGYLYSVKSINGSEDNLAPLAGLRHDRQAARPDRHPGPLSLHGAGGR